MQHEIYASRHHALQDSQLQAPFMEAGGVHDEALLTLALSEKDRSVVTKRGRS